MKTVLPFVMLILALGTRAHAQETPQDRVVAPGAPFVAGPDLSPEMLRLAFLIGEWATLEKTEPNEAAPAGEAHGTEVAEWGPGALHIISTYESSGGLMGDVDGLGIYSWNPVRQSYDVVWADSTMPGVLVSQGNWQGNDLVAESDMAVSGIRMRVKMVITKITKESYEWYMDIGEGTAPFKRAVTTIYTRKK